MPGQRLGQNPGVEATQRHDHEELEGNPDIDAVHRVAEHRVYVVVLEGNANELIQHRRKQEEPGKAARECIPTLLRVVKRLVEDVLEEIAVEPEPDEEKRREHCIEYSDLDLNPHRVLGDEGERAEDDR